MTKHQAMIDYLQGSPAFAGIACQFGEISDGSVIFNTVQGDTTISTDIVGTKTKHYDFAIVKYCARNTDAPSDLNMDTLNAVSGMMTWIDEQNKKRHFPKFENATVTKIENLQNMPTVAGTDDKQNLVKYMYQARVTYKTKED